MGWCSWMFGNFPLPSLLLQKGTNRVTTHARMKLVCNSSFGYGWTKMCAPNPFLVPFLYYGQQSRYFIIMQSKLYIAIVGCQPVQLPRCGPLIHHNYSSPKASGHTKKTPDSFRTVALQMLWKYMPCAVLGKPFKYGVPKVKMHVPIQLHALALATGMLYNTFCLRLSIPRAPIYDIF